MIRPRTEKGTRAFLSDRAGFRRQRLAADPSGVWCVQMQGGGESRRGASATDDNAADVRARPCDPGKVRKKGPSAP
ncbi:hypothetical protein GCM10010339_15670 [Streptomyces alanosinicus]|uniref:Uncharacterized protein n=1 Tax=Streptomyces alanosinicus TaxID=68171 RepID=A0A918YEA0_9ACTN|nr:hypothetical protein GCM10010339_15670 [Streptomyces alanosinicus]